MNFNSAVSRACEEKTLTEALTYICLWESERVVQQAHKNLTNNTPANDSGAMWETCFGICISGVMEEYVGGKE